MTEKSIHHYLKANGEKLDSEIAEALGLPLNVARQHLSELLTRGEIMSCHTTRFVDGAKSEGMTYRIEGHIPKNKPSAKSKVQLKLS
jgi:predicted ArsR family transcriptional regulator